MRVFGYLAMAAILCSAPLPAQERTGVTSVDSVDLDRYAGQWYEVARFPNEFQLKCTGNVTAYYTRLANGEIEVANSCRTTDGTVDTSVGRAKLAKKDGPTSRLRVRFAPAILGWLPMVWGDYWVLDLTDDYSAALVGTPDRGYLWILSRTPVLDEALYQRMVATAERQGFDVGRLVKTRQQ